MIEWRKKNPDSSKIVNKKSYYKHKEARDHQSKLKYAKNRAARLIYAKNYRKIAADNIRHLNARRRARVSGIPGSYTTEQWEILTSFFNGVCPVCLKHINKFSVDHIIPITKPGSSHWIDNIQPICRRCNSSKHDHTRDYRPEFVKEWAANEMRKICQP